jgi:hypothetical protein
MENTTENDYKKYFNPQEYITHIVGADKSEEETESDTKEVTLLTSLLTDPLHKDAKEETLLLLKKEKKEDFLLMAIAQQKDKKLLPPLVAACWESEINMSKYLPFFVLLALDDDFFVSLEAMTVISEMQGPFDQTQVKQAIQKIKEEQKKLNNEKVVLLNDLLDALNGFSIE